MESDGSDSVKGLSVAETLMHHDYFAKPSIQKKPIVTKLRKLCSKTARSRPSQVVGAPSREQASNSLKPSSQKQILNAKLQTLPHSGIERRYINAFTNPEIINETISKSAGALRYQCVNKPANALHNHTIYKPVQVISNQTINGPNQITSKLAEATRIRKRKEDQQNLGFYSPSNLEEPSKVLTFDNMEIYKQIDPMIIIKEEALDDSFVEDEINSRVGAELQNVQLQVKTDLDGGLLTVPSSGKCLPSPSYSWHSETSDGGYESTGSPHSIDSADFDSMWDQSVTELFPNLL